MKKYYKCNQCERFYKEKDIERISYSTDIKGYATKYILCKKCKKGDDKE